MPDSILRTIPRQVVTASAELITEARIADRGRPVFQDDAAQADLWMYYDILGEYAGFVDWLRNAGSRVRLGAAELIPGADEPEMLSLGPASDLVESFYGGTAGHSTFLAMLIPQLVVPGEGWVVAERINPSVPLALADWTVQSNQTIRDGRRDAGGGRTYDIQVGEGVWRPLMPDALPIRFWMPHPRRPWMARSPSIAALPTMQRLELADKRIVSELLSRIVMNGFLFMPNEMSLPASPAYKDRPNGFWEEWIDIASQNMRSTGTALAAMPMPVRVGGEFIEQIKHLRFAEPFDEQLLAEREFEIARLAKQLPLSPERQQGMSQSNHWSAFVIDESDIKISIAPIIEQICQGLTIGYLHPMLNAAGIDLLGPRGGKLVVWADYSELTSSGDKSQGAIAAYDRFEGSGDALRRELGLKATDAPSEAELRQMVILKAAMDPTNPANAAALSQLLGQPVAPAPAPSAPAAPVNGPAEPTSVGSPTGAAGLPSTSPTANPEPASVAPPVTASLNGHRPKSTSRR